MTTDRRRRSATTQLELPLRPHPSEVARAAEALRAAKAARAGRAAGAVKAGKSVKAAKGAPAVPAVPSASRHPGDWRLDERTRRIGRQGVAAARALLGDTTATRHPEEADKDRRRPRHAA